MLAGSALDSRRLFHRHSPAKVLPSSSSSPRLQRRKSGFRVRADRGDEDVREVMATLEAKSGLIANNPAFAQAFQGALQRQGVDAITRQQRVLDEKKATPAEEVLLEALRQARRNILRLENMKKAIESSIETEEKQFDRIQFALKRANGDAAYIRTLEKLRLEQRELDSKNAKF